ncbi:MAG: hypothetical protein BroJett002_37370 [Candidatus Brocadia sinica]|nr:MAG: hypothetical protein BroJett002_37370 [Candidatus Brocadia sinica]
MQFTFRVRPLGIAVITMAGLSGPRAGAEVNLPPGFEVVTFAVNDFGCTNADINDCGEIAFAQYQAYGGNHAEVFVYDNGQITRITDNNDRDVFPFINNRGQILWGRGLRNHGVTQLVLYDDGQETLIDEFKKSFNGWSLNNLGHIAWTRSQRWRRCPIKENMFIWDGLTTRQVTFDEEVSNVQASLNDHGDYAWARAWWCEQPWVSEIHLMVNGEDRTIPSPDPQNQGQKLSNAGWIVWRSSPYVVLWDGTQTRQLVEHGSGVPNLNDNGRVYIPVWDFIVQNKFQPWVLDIDDEGLRSFRIADVPWSFSRGYVNNWGEVSCIWYEDPPNSNWRGGVLLLRHIRSGDSEFDGDIDLLDYRILSEGMTGPVRTDGLCQNRFLDIDYDGDLDLADFSRLQNAFTGASP